MGVFVFLASGILEDGSVNFFPCEFLSFFETECFFFNGRVSFFGFKHFGKRFCGLFSCEFIFLKHLASGILVGTFLCFSFELKNIFNSIVFQ